MNRRSVLDLSPDRGEKRTDHGRPSCAITMTRRLLKRLGGNFTWKKNGGGGLIVRHDTEGISAE